MKVKLLTSALLILGGMALAGCTSSQEVPLSAAANNEIASQSLSTFSLLNTPQGATALKRALLSDQAIDLTEQEIADIKAILGQVDTILANQTGVTSEVIASTQEGYEYGLLVTYTDIFANSSSYSLFYNQTANRDEDLCDGECEAIGDQSGYRHGQGDENDEHGNNDKIKTMSFLNGILISGEETYQFTSIVKEEVEGDETETKVNFKLFNDAGFFVKAMTETEIENDEVESRIRYTVFDGETVVTSYCLKVEQGADENAEIKLRLDDKVYFIEQLFVEGREFLDVRYSIDDVTTHILFEKVVTIDDVTQSEVVEFIIVE